MDSVTEWLQNVALFAVPLVIYVFFIRNIQKKRKLFEIYTIPSWNFTLKKIWAYFEISKLLNKKRRNLPFVKKRLFASQDEYNLEKPNILPYDESFDSMSIFGIDNKGNLLHVKINRQRYRQAEIWLQIRLNNGEEFELPSHPHTVMHNYLSKTWNSNGLSFQVCEPFRKWRITYNGLLRSGKLRRNAEDSNDDKFEHIKFNFIWTACSVPVDCHADWNPCLLSEAIARERWRDGNWMYMMEDFDKGYDQWGTLYGEMMKSDGSISTLHLRGLRERRFGLNPSIINHRSVNFKAILNDGTMFTIGAISSQIGITHATYGHVKLPTGKTVSISWCDLQLPHLAEVPETLRQNLTLHFKAGGKYYKAVISVLKNKNRILYSGEPWNSEIHLQQFETLVNMTQGIGIAEYWYKYDGDCPVAPTQNTQFLLEPDVEPGPLVVTFADRECQSSRLVGGKGSSLALITSLNDPEFNVPPGFCLTTTSLEEQLKNFPELENGVNELESMADENQLDKLKEKCAIVSSLFETVPICSEVQTHLETTFLQFDMTQPYAIRSSAIGEDSEDLSAAGQNSTFLGCLGKESIMKHICKCWASLYSFQSVEYRRQHGQSIRCSMGIVVQLMIPSEVSGVLFTSHPTTGNPGEILITSNYGLGETVVSAQVEPDHFIISRSWKNDLKLKEAIPGKKEFKIEMSGDGSLSTTHASDNLVSSDLSLSESQALALASLGVQLEAMFTGPRDIEWAVSKEKVYLLQARPITSLNNWTDFELTHEFDSPITTDFEILTKANVGEVLPGATSPLALSAIGRTLDACLQKSTNAPFHQSYFPRALFSSNYHFFLNVLNTVLCSIEEKITPATLVCDMAVFGHPVTTPEMHKLAIGRHGAMKLFKKALYMLKSAKMALNNKKTKKKAMFLSKIFYINYKRVKSASLLYQEIDKSLSDLIKIATYHSDCSSVNVFAQIVALTILLEDEKEFSIEHYNDISMILSTFSDVVSANVPTDLKKIADGILISGREEEFCSLPPPLATDWLRVNIREPAERFTKFLSDYGHRSIKEFDVMTETWSMKPEVVVETIQAMVKHPQKTKKEEKKEFNVDHTISQMKSFKKKNTKTALRWLLPWCRKTVITRETTKACFISAIHQFRMAYRKLGALMVQESRLPSAELVFYISHYELGRLLQERDPTIVAKAVRRKRLYNKWNDLKYPEIVHGLPAPLPDDMEIINSTGMKVHGTPVYPGTVVGRACVIHKLEEISQLKPLDVLITKSTDIGWSPYFPVVSGVVTELGGLISHGAVVAREYGLPCIVGSVGATSMFETGDTVLLMASSGTIEKISEESES